MELLEYWRWFAFVIEIALTLSVSFHVLMTKRDPRSAVAWMAIVWLVPLFGAVFYFLFGINRIQRNGWNRTVFSIFPAMMIRWTFAFRKRRIAFPSRASGENRNSSHSCANSSDAMPRTPRP